MEPTSYNLCSRTFKTDKYELVDHYFRRDMTLVRNLSNKPITVRYLHETDLQMFYRYVSTPGEMDWFFDTYLENKLSVLIHGTAHVKNILETKSLK